MVQPLFLDEVSRLLLPVAIVARFDTVQLNVVGLKAVRVNVDVVNLVRNRDMTMQFTSVNSKREVLHSIRFI